MTPWRRQASTTLARALIERLAVVIGAGTRPYDIDRSAGPTYTASMPGTARMASTSSTAWRVSIIGMHATTSLAIEGEVGPVAQPGDEWSDAA